LECGGSQSIGTSDPYIVRGIEVLSDHGQRSGDRGLVQDPMVSQVLEQEGDSMLCALPNREQQEK
jgi:hypothetical protein